MKFPEGRRSQKIMVPPSQFQGIRSQWDFEISQLHHAHHVDFTLGYVMSEVTWNELPMWALSIYLRRILLMMNMPLSAVARLAEHYLRGDERGVAASNLLPLPLPDVSAEEKQDRALRQYDEVDHTHANYARLTREWEDMGIQLWLWLATVGPNFLHSG